jgi:trigger factor
MQTSIENLSPLERRMTMAVPMAEIDKQVDERLKRIARTVKMSGFRPGKVPMKIVAQQYGPQIRSEVIGDAVEKAFSEAVRGQNLRVAGYPKVEPKQGDEGGNLEFTATFEIYPEVALGDLTKAEIERPVLEVTDAEVERTLEVLRKQRTTYETAERAAQVGDRVVIDFVGRVDGAEFAGGKGEDFAVVLGEGRMLPDFEAGLAGMSAGETKTFPVKFPDDYHGKDVAGKTAEFETTLRRVEAPRLPAIDADFAKSLGVADGDLGKMRAEVRANVEREVRKRLGDDLKQRVMQALLASTQPALPKALVDMEIQRLVQNARSDLESRGMKMENLPIDPQLFEEQAKRRVALGLIIGEAVKGNGLAARPEQVRALVEEQAQSYEQPGEVVKWFYSQPERLAEFEGLAVEQNVVDWVLRQARVVDKPVAFEQLMGNAA